MSILVNDTLATIYKDGTFTALARVVDWNNTAITQSGITSIAYTAYSIDTTGLTAITNHTSVSVSKTDCVFNTLQTASLWTKDTTGYNFRHTIDVVSHSAFTTIGTTYLVVYTITPTSGQKIIFRYKVQVV